MEIISGGNLPGTNGTNAYTPGEGGGCTSYNCTAFNCSGVYGCGKYNPCNYIYNA